jgi:hypothetical protein
MHPKLLTGSLLLFFLAFTAGAFAQSAGPTADDSALIRRLADTILTDGKAYSNLRVLTKTVGARLSGSAGFYKGEKWGQAALEDAGSDKVWLQECMVPHWVRGGKDLAEWRRALRLHKDGTVISGAEDRGDMDILALGNSVGTGPEGIEAQVILIHDFDELERRKDELKGKIVFYNYKFNPLFIETFISRLGREPCGKVWSGSDVGAFDERVGRQQPAYGRPELQ